MLCLATLVAATYFVWDPTRSGRELERDIRELDVGNMGDMTEDVSPTFIEEMELNKEQVDEAAALMRKRGTQMTFAVLNHDLMARQFPAGDAEETVAMRWSGMLQNGGIS